MGDSIPTSNEAAPDIPVSPAMPTPLSEFLLRTNPALALRTHEDVLTPYTFDAAEPEAAPPTDARADAEVDAALDSAAAVDLGWLTRIAVTGEDRTRWLAGMTTNAVQTLAEGAGDYNFVLNAQGRIQGDLYAFRETDRLVLETTRSQVERLLQHLDRFIIMDDVELHPLPSLTALGVVGPEAGTVLGKLGFDGTQVNMIEQRPWLWNDIPLTVVRAYSTSIPRFELWLAPEHVAAVWRALLANGCHPAGLHAAETLRIAEGIPAYGVDILEKHLAQETSQTRALSFSKGCYLGQEIVERIRSRASIHRALRQFELAGSVPAAGTELQADGKPSGHLSSIATMKRKGKARILAIGMVRTEALNTKSKIEYDGGVAIPLETPPLLTGF